MDDGQRAGNDPVPARGAAGRRIRFLDLIQRQQPSKANEGEQTPYHNAD